MFGVSLLAPEHGALTSNARWRRGKPGRAPGGRPAAPQLLARRRDARGDARRFTHPEVEFVVGGKRVDMRPGELWALDTSYEHSVRNRSNQVRVHLVVEVVANDWVWSLLPKKGVAYYATSPGSGSWPAGWA